MRGSVRFSSGAFSNFIRIYKNVDKISKFYYLEWIYDQELWPQLVQYYMYLEIGNIDVLVTLNIAQHDIWYT